MLQNIDSLNSRNQWLPTQGKTNEELKKHNQNINKQTQQGFK